jgi:hypothetical protein
MKALLSCLLVSAFSAGLFGQGALAPPGGPAPSMKSLDQIEPRTPVSSLPFTISTPGSYYMTKNLSVASGDGITISASNVMLDLNGCTISSTAASATGTAIRISSSFRNITIVNGGIAGGVTVSGGTFSGSGFAGGIDVPSGFAGDIFVRHVTVRGLLQAGIRFADTVESCSVDTVGGGGIDSGTVTNSTALNCGLVAINAITVENCYGTSFNTTGIGAAATVSN